MSNWFLCHPQLVKTIQDITLLITDVSQLIGEYWVPLSETGPRNFDFSTYYGDILNELDGKETTKLNKSPNWGTFYHPIQINDVYWCKNLTTLSAEWGRHQYVLGRTGCEYVFRILNPPEYKCIWNVSYNLHTLLKQSMSPSIFFHFLSDQHLIQEFELKLV